MENKGTVSTILLLSDSKKDSVNFINALAGGFVASESLCGTYKYKFSKNAPTDSVFLMGNDLKNSEKEFTIDEPIVHERALPLRHNINDCDSYCFCGY